MGKLRIDPQDKYTSQWGKYMVSADGYAYRNSDGKMLFFMGIKDHPRLKRMKADSADKIIETELKERGMEKLII